MAGEMTVDAERERMQEYQGRREQGFNGFASEWWIDHDEPASMREVWLRAYDDGHSAATADRQAAVDAAQAQWDAQRAEFYRVLTRAYSGHSILRHRGGIQWGFGVGTEQHHDEILGEVQALLKRLEKQ